MNYKCLGTMELLSEADRSVWKRGLLDEAMAEAVLERLGELDERLALIRDITEGVE